MFFPFGSSSGQSSRRSPGSLRPGATTPYITRKEYLAMTGESISEKAEPRSHALAEAGPGLTGPEYRVYPRMVKMFAFDV
jgi:hypothetical protein